MVYPPNREDVGTETGPRAAGISQLELPPPRVGVQALQDRRKSHRLARPRMGTNQKHSLSLKEEVPAESEERLQPDPPGACVPGSAVHCRGGTCQRTLASLNLQH